MRPASIGYLVLLLSGALPGVTSAQQTAMEVRQKVDLSKLGPQVGQPAPEFSLRDQAGAVRTLASVMGPSGAMLVFYRSADW